MGLIDGIVENMITTASRKIIDDSIQKNASHANGVGLEVRVTRVYDRVGVHDRKDECEWCKSRCKNDMTLQEAYEIGAFQRHEGCGCVIEYVSAKGERTYQTGKSRPDNWLSVEEFERRVNYGLGGRTITPQERIINAAIEMQIRDARSMTLVDAIIKNHEALKYYSPESMKKRLERAGYKVLPLTQSKSGFSGVPFEEGGGFKVLFGGDGIFQYHPKGGRHRIAYWKIRSGKGGLKHYDTSGKEIVP